jgi:sulfate transport system permease protein
MMAQRKSKHVLPGFGLTMGVTLTYLGLIVLIPLLSLALKASGIGWARFIEIAASPRVIASLRLSFGASLIAASVNVVFGLMVAWVLVRYRFPGRRLVDAIVDIPFALPTAVAGIALTTIYSSKGWIGSLVKPLGIKIAYTQLGVVVALTFVSLPLVVRSIQPLLEELDPELEEAATSLGSPRWQVFMRVIIPELSPAIVTGFALSLARSVGEYGSVVFISGNLPMRTEIAPLLIISKLEQYDYAGATAIAVIMLSFSFAILLGINILQYWRGRALAAA